MKKQNKIIIGVVAILAIAGISYWYANHEPKEKCDCQK